MKSKKPTEYFDEELAAMLAEKVTAIYPGFDGNAFVKEVAENCAGKRLKQRVELIADQLHGYLPDDYPKTVNILIQILGPENHKETGMFSQFYWLMPVAKFVEKYGVNYFAISITAIEEITKRNTGEYAIRPFIRAYPQQTLEKMQAWANSDNFHLRRLASEGLRPKLPWAPKLDLFVEEPKPVFEILENLKEDPIRFVQKSVANNIADYLKVNPDVATPLIQQWQESTNKHTQWIIKHATRNHEIV